MPPCLRENGGAQPIRVNGMATVNMIMLSSAYEGTNGERAYPRVPTCHARQEMSACRQGAESARVQKTVAARPTGQEGHARRRRAHAHASRAHQAGGIGDVRSTMQARPGRGTDRGDKFKVDVRGRVG